MNFFKSTCNKIPRLLVSFIKVHWSESNDGHEERINHDNTYPVINAVWGRSPTENGKTRLDMTSLSDNLFANKS